MDSDDDYQSFLPTEENPSPVRQRKLKRLKKSASIPSQPVDENPSKKSNISSSETLDIIQPVNPTPSVLVDPEGFDQDEDSIKTLDTLDSVDPVPSALVPYGIDQGDSVKPLGITDSVDPETDTPDEMESVDPIQPVLESESIEQGSDSIEEFVVKESDLINELRAEMGMVKTEKRSEKKRRSSSEGVEEMKDKTKKKKKKKDEKDVADKEEIPKAPVPTKRQLEKERKIHLEQLHAETQRLLRESRDAEFKPVPIVQKPISSILAKIRQRKLEVSKKASSLSIYYADSNDSLEVNKLDYSDKHAQSADRGEEKHPEEFQDKDAPLIYEKSNHLDAVNVDTLSQPASSSFQHESYVANTVLDEESKSACVNPQKDAQDVLLGSQPRHMEDGEDEESKSACPTPKKNTEEISLGSQPREEEDAPADSQLDSPIGEVLAPSLLTMQLRLDAAQPNETSSGEEESDKENVEPDPRKLDDLDSNLDTIGDPVKAFLDDEAEEEDDSDDDLAQFKDDEDEEEDELNEELKDLIAYGYEEKPVDNEKRDQLHQMWLQQQDAAETDNVLQRLRCGAKQKGPSMLEEEEEEEEEDDEPGDDLVDHHQSSKNIVRMISKKAKQMIPEMFTDKDDTFLSSDDEETDQKIVRQRLLEKAVEDSSLLPPAVDESSSEVFGLIRKLNVAPDTKKKAKPSSIFDVFITGGNSNSSSKFSFLGRASSNSLPASTKHVSSNVRSFIFGRDDSNSRSGISTSEVSLDMGELEKRAPRNASAKFSGSQTKSSTQSTVVTETSRTGSSSSSLLEVLRRSSSMQSDHHTRNINMVGQTQACFQFAAFKPGKIAALKPGKKQLKVEGKT